MDSTQTKLLVANGGLSKIGVARMGTFGESTTIQGLRIADTYPQLRDYCLSQNGWSFATKTVLLTPNAILWITNYAYAVGNYIINTGVVYKCLVAHTSGNFTTDLAALDWSANNWLTATAYVYGDFVNQSDNVYACVIPHTSGTFATDLANGIWVQQTSLTLSMPNFGDGVNLAYAYPSDWIKPIKWNFNSAIRRLEKSAIFSDTAGLCVKYIYQNDDPTTYTPEFIEAFQSKIAAELAYPLTQNAAKGKEMLDEFDSKLIQAMAADSQGGTPDQPICDEWFIARLSGSNAPPSLPGQVSFSSTGTLGF